MNSSPIPPNKEAAPTCTSGTAMAALTLNSEYAGSIQQHEQKSTGETYGTKASKLEKIYWVLGSEAVLLPLPQGSKKITIPEWHKTTLDSSKTPEYQSKLTESDIGVLLGETGNGICTVDCDSEDGVQAFLNANRWAERTLRTRGNRGANFWFRIKGAIPQSCELREGERAVGEWRAGGNQTKITGTHPDTSADYVWLVEAPAMEVNFADICWPESWSGRCIKTDFDRLVERVGSPFSTLGRGLRVNEMFFTELFREENGVVFEPDENRFYLYNEDRGLWEPTTEARLKVLLLSLIKDFAGGQNPKEKEELELLRTEQRAGALVRLLRGSAERRGVFQTKKRFVHVRNTVIEFSSKGIKLMGFSPDYFSRNQVPVSYEQDAKCPRFLNDLLGPALPTDDILLLQKWIGNVLLGGNPAQVLLIQEGLAGTGKSTVASVLEALIGTDSVVQLRTELLNERFETARYIGRRLLAGRDVSGDFLNRRGVGVLKALTGGDKLDGEVKGGMGQPSVRGLDVIVTANSRLRVKLDGDIEAWSRRILIISYQRPRPVKPIPDLAKNLIESEGAGILNWALEGACAALKDLESHGKLVLSQTQSKRVEKLLEESNSLRVFVQKCVRDAPTNDITTEELIEAYSNFCEQQGWIPVSTHDAGRQLPDLILEQFGKSKRNDIKRSGKANKGYSGLST